jgi:hypothetical protein
MIVDVIDFRKIYLNVPRSEEVEEAVDVPIKIVVKDKETGENRIETRLEPRVVKKTVNRIEAVERIYVEYCQPGMRGRQTTLATIGEIQSIEDAVAGEEDNDDRIKSAMKRDAILEAYEFWKRGQTMPVHGTPLGAWPAITPSMKQGFNMVGIQTVEEVRDLTEVTKARCAHIGDIAGLIKQASLFLNSADAMKTASEMATLQNENAELKEQMTDAMSALAEMQKMLHEMKEEPQKRQKPPREQAA